MTDVFDVRAAAYRNFAAPGMNQMYRSFVSGTSYTATSPNLQAQTNVGQEIGFDLNTAVFGLSATVFQNKMNNFIDFAALCTTVGTCNPLIAGTGLAAGSISTVLQYVNAGDATFRGHEILLRVSPTKDLQITGGYARVSAYLTRSQYTTPAATPPDPVNAQIGQVPPWMANVAAVWQALPNLSLMLQVKSFPGYWNNTGHTQRNDGATLADIGATFKASRTVDIYGSVQNIGNAKYLDQGLTYTTFQGSTVSASGLPALGMPRIATLGIRASV